MPPAAPPPAEANLASFSSSAETSPSARIAALEATVRETQAMQPAALSEATSAPADPVAPSADYEVGSDKALTAKWNHGLELQSRRKDLRIHVGGRTQFDNSFFDNDPAIVVSPAIGGIGPQPDSMQFRRGRLRIDGTLYEVFDFVAEYDFVNTLAPASPTTGQPVVAVPGVTELWGMVTHLPVVGNFRFGNMKEPIGMEHINSSRFLPFIERSFLQDAIFGPFNNGFTPGGPLRILPRARMRTKPSSAARTLPATPRCQRYRPSDASS